MHAMHRKLDSAVSFVGLRCKRYLQRPKVGEGAKPVVFLVSIGINKTQQLNEEKEADLGLPESGEVLTQ